MFTEGIVCIYVYRLLILAECSISMCMVGINLMDEVINLHNSIRSINRIGIPENCWHISFKLTEVILCIHFIFDIFIYSCSFRNKNTRYITRWKSVIPVFKTGTYYQSSSNLKYDCVSAIFNFRKTNINNIHLKSRCVKNTSSNRSIRYSPDYNWPIQYTIEWLPQICWRCISFHHFWLVSKTESFNFEWIRTTNCSYLFNWVSLIYAFGEKCSLNKVFQLKSYSTEFLWYIMRRGSFSISLSSKGLHELFRNNDGNNLSFQYTA